MGTLLGFLVGNVFKVVIILVMAGFFIDRLSILSGQFNSKG